MYVRRTRPRAIPLAMTIKDYQHAFKYDYGAPLPRPTAAEEFRYNLILTCSVVLWGTEVGDGEGLIESGPY